VAGLDRSGRDASRSPMHWDATPLGGFTSGTPWLAPGETRTCNVADQQADPDSLLALYRRLIQLRHASAAIGLGDQRSIDLPADSAALAFLREVGNERALVTVNVAPEQVVLDIASASRGRVGSSGRLVLSTVTQRAAGEPLALGGLVLAGHEAVIVGLPAR